MFSSWSTAVKLAWSVPRNTRTFLLQKVLSSGFSSAKVDILARFGNFFKTLKKSPSYEVAVLANLVGRDVRTTTGSNLRLLQERSGLDPWECSSSKLKVGLALKEEVMVPVEDCWRVKYLGTLLGQRQELHYLGHEEEKGLVTELIDSLCVN